MQLRTTRADWVGGRFVQVVRASAHHAAGCLFESEVMPQCAVRQAALRQCAVPSPGSVCRHAPRAHRHSSRKCASRSEKPAKIGISVNGPAPHTRGLRDSHCAGHCIITASPRTVPMWTVDSPSLTPMLAFGTVDLRRLRPRLLPMRPVHSCRELSSSRGPEFPGHGRLCPIPPTQRPSAGKLDGNDSDGAISAARRAQDRPSTAPARPGSARPAVSKAPSRRPTSAGPASHPAPLGPGPARLGRRVH
jgi:hypothetical protein